MPLIGEASSSCLVSKAGYLSSPGLVLEAQKFPGIAAVPSPQGKHGSDTSEMN